MDLVAEERKTLSGHYLVPPQTYSQGFRLCRCNLEHKCQAADLGVPGCRRAQESQCDTQ